MSTYEWDWGVWARPSESGEGSPAVGRVRVRDRREVRSHGRHCTVAQCTQRNLSSHVVASKCRAVRCCGLCTHHTLSSLWSLESRVHTHDTYDLKGHGENVTAFDTQRDLTARQGAHTREHTLPLHTGQGSRPISHSHTFT